MRKDLIAAMTVLCLVPHASRAQQGSSAPKARVDQFGDPLPAKAVARLGTARWRLYESPLAFAPNGRYAIVANQSTRLLDAATGIPKRVFPQPSWRAFFTRDSRITMLGHDQRIRWLDVETGKITRELAINGIPRGWSADGKRMVCMHQIKGGSWNFCVWDLEGGRELCRWNKESGDCTLSADGSLLAVRGVRECAVFSVPGKKLVSQWDSEEPFAGRTVDARVVLFLPDGKTLIAAESKRVLLWDATRGKLKPKGKLRRRRCGHIGHYP
jgi:WD40 repeat protein